MGGWVANNKGVDQSVHLRRLISTFVIRFFLSIISLNFNFVATLCILGEWFESHFGVTPKTGFLASRLF